MSLASLALLLAAASAAVAPAAASPSRTELLPYEDVLPGMKGTGWTVFHGEHAESFEVEVLGKLDRIGPGQNLILARLGSPTLAATGVLEGMSGSPVYVDGRLIGAVAYSWGFSREAIAGITPIGEMSALFAAPRAGPAATPAPRAAAATALGLEELLEPMSAALRFDAEWARLLRRAGASAVPQVGLPFIASGLSGDWLAGRVPEAGGSVRRRIGGSAIVSPVRPAGAETSNEASSSRRSDLPVGGARLAAGEAVGAQLVQGDVDLTAFGTVTQVEGDKVLAFGHAFLQLGPIEYPMIRARIETLLPSLASSFKIASASEEVGAFQQDRAAGLAGRLGGRATMVPVRLRLEVEGAEDRSFSYQVVSDPILTPILLYLTVGGILETAEKAAGDASVSLLDGSAIHLEGERKADLANTWAGPFSVLRAAASVALVADALVRNEHEPATIQGVNLLLRYAHDIRQARITGAWTDRVQVRAGDRMTVTVGLKPYREAESHEAIPVEIPRHVQPGRLTLHVGDARSVTRIEQAGADGLMPLDLDNLLDLINTMRRNHSLAILATREEPSILIGSAPFPNLPPSKASLILRREGRGNFPVLRTRSILDETRDTDFAIEGYRRVEVEVVP